MRRRHLREDELELWRRVTDTAERLTPARPTAPACFAPPKILPKPGKPAQPAPDRIPQFSVGQKAGHPRRGHDLLPGLTDRMAALPVRMDKKAHGKLKRGKMKPEGRIDLHGMTVDRAHTALSAFVMRSYGQGKRLILVITGKGKRSDDDGPIPVRQGVLRHNVPHWLSLPPMTQMVMQVSEAHGRHGGGGAYYVYLRRPK